MHTVFVSLVAVVSLATMAGPLAHAGDQAWTRNQTSTGLQAIGRAVSVAFAPPSQESVPARARITQVYASRAYAGSARVAAQLCWGSPSGPCVALKGTQLDSHAFDGRPAQGPLWLVYRVEGWGVDHPPLFVQGTVTVWFSDSAH